MKLQQQIERIELLKTDKHLGLLLEGLKVLAKLNNFSSELVAKHKGKNPTFNQKLWAYRGDLVDGFDAVSNDFYEPTVNEICEFIGFDKGDDAIHSVIFDYSCGDYTLDEFVEELKEWAIDVNNIPKGHIMIKSEEFGVQYIPEENDPFTFLDDEE